MPVLPDSVGNFTSLQSLDVYGCSTLETLTYFTGNLTGLQGPDLRGGSFSQTRSFLQTFPDWFGNLSGLQSLRCSLQKLPDSLGNFMGF